jgi:hypothetical protein
MKTMNFAGAALAVLAIASAPVLTAAEEPGSMDLAVAVAESLPPAPVSPADVRLSRFSLADPAPSLKAYRITATSTTVGYVATGVPCYTCDPNAGYTIAIPIPISQWVIGTTADITVQWDDVNYTGACTISYALVQGTTTVASGSSADSCLGNSVSYATFTVTIPNVSGPTKVVGTVAYGTAQSSAGARIYINNGK